MKPILAAKIRIFRSYFLFYLLLFTLPFTAMAHQSMTADQVLHYKVKHYWRERGPKLLTYFKQANVKFPPKKLAFLVFKRSQHFELWAKNSGRWHYIHTFNILAASGHAGPKLHEGDYQVPEGIYRISELNPESHYDLSMQVNYPNAFDRLHGAWDHRKHLGGNIFIHGEQSSAGCVAMGDRVIEELFPLVYYVGPANVKVIIAPNDLRHQRPLYAKHHPKWLPTLYAKIAHALAPFKV